MDQRRIRLGVAGLGRAFMLMLPTLVRHPAVRLVAAADPRAAARDGFHRDFGGRAYATVAELCADAEVDAVYVATPHQHHVVHVGEAAAQGKHVLVEKPMALSLADCRAMIAAARSAHVHLLVGHSHSYDLPYLRTRALIDTGAFGRVRMINAINFTDYLYRPRRPEELDTAVGGGAVFGQAPHQVELVRLLAGCPVRRVRAVVGLWDPTRPTEGAYTALLTFADGAAASLTYNGYGYFDSDELVGWIGEMGQAREPAVPGASRAAIRALGSPAEEAAQKDRRAYGTTLSAADARNAPLPHAHDHFGSVIVSCERGHLRPTPTGVAIYADDGRRFEALPPPAVPRSEVIDELAAAILDDRPPIHDGEWGMATIEVCLALLQSSREDREIAIPG